MKMIKVLRLGYVILLCGIAVLFGVFLRQGQWLETDLRALLPQENRWQSVQILADRQMEAQLNQQIVALVGNRDANLAYETAEKVAQEWQASGLFSQIKSKTQPDLAQLQREIQTLKFAVLPKNVRAQLSEDPKAYFQHYAEQLANPFLQTNLLPLEEDWLGFGRFVLPQSQQLSKMQWNAENGFVFVEENGVTWVLLNGQLPQNDMLNATSGLISLVEKSQQIATQTQSEWLVTGASLFSAVAKMQAEQESTLMSVLGIGLTLVLLLSVFRSGRALWLFLPIGVGMLAGVTLTVALLGQIHILTLVIGTSLVGVLIDFPLHWLSSSLFAKHWNGERAMNEHRFTFLITLGITLLGYGLLWFTDLPILKQTALFSSIALVAAVFCTMLFLPKLIRQAKPMRSQERKFSGGKISRIASNRWLVLGLIALIGVGVYRSNWKDDIRQWVAMPESMLHEAQKIGELTGIELGSQYFLVLAENEDELLSKTAQLSAKLTALAQPHQALNQWIMSAQEQKALAEKLQAISPSDYTPLSEMGIPNAQIQHSQNELKNRPLVGLAQATESLLGQGWKPLYLGNLTENQMATIVKVSGVKSVSALRELANNRDIFWQDKRSFLNEAFEQTRNQAGWLKVISFVIAGLFLWKLFGVRKAGQILLVPAVAIFTTVGVLGWLSLPISLFAMFGLLLVSAIGIDYSTYMLTVKESVQSKRVAVTLAMMTTMISFGLLALSSTPAVAGFGLSVMIGVLVSGLLSYKIA